MSIKHYRFALGLAVCGLAAGFASGAAVADDSGSESILGARQVIYSDGDFARLHPEKAAELFAALNFKHPGLERAAAAHARGDLEATAVEVAAYFRRSSHGAWLREAEYRHGPGGYEDAIALAEKVLADEYRFQSISGPVARLGNGRIDWDDLGPRKDREWQFFLNRHFHLVPLVKA